MLCRVTKAEHQMGRLCLSKHIVQRTVMIGAATEKRGRYERLNLYTGFTVCAAKVLLNT